MADHQIDGLLITHPADLAYLSGFTGDDSIGVMTARSLVLVTDFRFTEQAAIEAPWMRVIARKGKMAEAVAKALSASRVRRVGFEANFCTYGTIEAIRRALAGMKLDIELVSLNDALVNVRKTKQPSEVETIRSAGRCAQEAFLAVKRSLKSGQTENDLAAKLVYEMGKRGASGASFPPIVASGPSSSLPHYRPANLAIKNNALLLIDWGAHYNGYCSDLTRTLIVGKVSRKLREIYNVTLEAQLAAIDKIRAGVTNRAVDKAARDVITRAGYGKFFGHGLGHGIGRDIHESPRVSHLADEEPLGPGMVITVEPGIYLAGEGGVRIEDDVVVTERGCEMLTSLDKRFEECQITL